MVVSDRFIWLHFPKCSGTETERLLKQNFGVDPNIRFDKIDQANVIWHHTIGDRKAYDSTFAVSGRGLICNIRRLPLWLLSRIHYEYVRSVQHKVTRSMFLAGEFFEASGALSKADSYAERYSSPSVNHWIRTEHLAQDFRTAFSNYLDLSDIDLNSQVLRTNVSRISYIENVEFYFSKKELENLYRSNPIWTGIERGVYGDLYGLG